MTTIDTVFIATYFVIISFMIYNHHDLTMNPKEYTQVSLRCIDTQHQGHLVREYIVNERDILDLENGIFFDAMKCHEYTKDLK